MGYYCTVPQCTSLAGKTKNVKFHRFPRDVTMADKWNNILKRGKPYTKYSKVCSLHFTQADYNVTTMGQWKTLSKDAVPSQNLPKLHPDGTVMVIRKSRTIKYRDSRKDSTSDKSDKWSSLSHQPPMSSVLVPTHHETNPQDAQDPNMAYRLQTLSAIASAMPPQPPAPAQPSIKPKKQDAIMQTDPVQSEEDDTQPNNSYSETSENSYNSEQLEYPKDAYMQQYPKDKEYNPYKSENEKKYDTPKDYTKQEDYIPQTNEEYNKEAEKYALERRTYEKSIVDYQKVPEKSHTSYEKPGEYQKLQEMYPFDKDYPRNDYLYQYPDSVEILRNQQHNLEMLQQQHRVNENQNFFNENHIKQEVDINSEEEKFLYERAKDQLDASAMYAGVRSVAQQQRLLEHLQHQVKQEPDTGGCDNVMQPQGSPYYAPNGLNGHTNSTGGYYEQISRPGPELLIAKQNALAAHTQLWQNTMKRPFFYSDTPHYSPLHRYEDLTRILQ